MPLQPFDIVSDYKEAAISKFDPQQLVNMYVDVDPTGKGGKALFMTPGLKLIKSHATAGEGRAQYVFRDKLYQVIKNKIYQVDSSLNRVTIGEINTEIGYVGIADNGRHIIFVDGAQGWLWDNVLSTFSQITSSFFPSAPQDVEILGSRFVVTATSELFYYSASNDGTNWGTLGFPLQYYSVGSESGNTVGLGHVAGRMFVFAEKTTGVWYTPQEASTSPYLRASVMDYGCAARGSIANDFGILMWLTKTPQGVGSVVITTGTQPESVSTEPIEKEFHSYSDVSDARAFLYKNDAGHIFYQINIPSANKSWMYDLLQRTWCGLEYKASARSRSQNISFFNNTHYTLDYENGKMYELSENYLDDDGINIRRARVTPTLFDPKYNEMSLNRIIVDMMQGTGESSGEDDDPVLFLRVSRDGGVSYGNQIQAKIGKIGQRMWRTEFYSLGVSRSFIFELEHYNKVPVCILGMSVDVTPIGDNQ